MRAILVFSILISITCNNAWAAPKGPCGLPLQALLKAPSGEAQAARTLKIVPASRDNPWEKVEIEGRRGTYWTRLAKTIGEGTGDSKAGFTAAENALLAYNQVFRAVFAGKEAPSLKPNAEFLVSPTRLTTDGQLLRLADADERPAFFVALREAGTAVVGGDSAAARFRALDDQARKDFLEGYNDEAELQGLKFAEFVTQGPTGADAAYNAADAKTRTLIKKLQDQFKSDIDTDVEANEPQVKIGPIEYTVKLLMTKDGEVIGGSVFGRQNGGQWPDEMIEQLRESDDGLLYHVDTMAEAEAKGVDTGADVSWGTTGYYDVKDGEISNVIDTGDYMEWSGH
jgi:hypothetical protein